jgi:hypothetical protein
MDIVVWLRSLGPVRPSRPSARPSEHPREPDFGGGVAAAGCSAGRRIPAPR